MSNISFFSVDNGVQDSYFQQYHQRSIFMRKDKNAFFIANINKSLPTSMWPCDDITPKIADYTSQLLYNDGAFFCLIGVLKTPLALLMYMREYNLTFGQHARKLRIEPAENGQYIDVYGNVHEQRHVFHYRFYDLKSFRQWAKHAIITDPNAKTIIDSVMSHALLAKSA